MVSLVVPDLLETTKSARLRLTPSVTCLTAPGSVESSTSMSGKPIFEPKVSLKTAPVGDAADVLRVAPHDGGRGEPAEPVSHRGRVALPERGVLHPEAIEELAR